MKTMTYYEARTHFSALLDRIAKGEQVLITRRGRPAAVLSPPPREDAKTMKELIAEMKELRKGNILGPDLTIRDLIEEGRRY
jgi:prevent-host-death family protein